MTELPVVYLRVTMELEGGHSAVGTGACTFSPMWFEKDPSRSFEERAHRLLVAVRIAVDTYLDAGADTAWGLHATSQPVVRELCASRDIGALSSSFGVALLDAAVVDGLCRHHGATFHAALFTDLLGFGPVPWLPEQPTRQLSIRHTVGLGDPLIGADVSERLGDGLPETLEEVVRDYGVCYFKVKIGGDTAANIERLCRIHEVLQREAAEDYRVVLDGNESFADMESFTPFVETLRAEPRLQELHPHLMWFEQPVERNAALADAVRTDLLRIGEFKPVILDESDGTDETVEQALSLGYGGVSAKSCKGVFRTLHSRRLLAGTGQAVLAAEDLTNPPLLPLHQDTATVAAIGCTHAERNAHHYVRGLSFLTEREQEQALRDHPSLYERTGEDLVRLRIRGGAIDLAELNRSGFGGTATPDQAALEPLCLPDPTESR